MNIGWFELKTADVLNVYKAKNVGIEVGTGTAFAEVLGDCLQNKLSMGNKMSESKVSAVLSELKSGGSERLKDKYCSLCGSAINEDGSCPVCIVPIFVSGKGNINNQNIVQAHDLQTADIQSK